MRDSTLAVSMVDDYGASARLLAATTLRNVLGTKSLEARYISERKRYGLFCCREFCSGGSPLPRRCRTFCTRLRIPGASLLRGSRFDRTGHEKHGCKSCFQVKDVRVPEQLMRAMAAEAEAARNARAKVWITR